MLLDKSILIQAPPERVFAWLAPARAPLWDRSLVRAAAREGPGGPLHAGAVVDRVSRALGCRFESATELTELVEGRRLAWRQVAGDYEENAASFTLEPSAGGTRLRLVAAVELPFVLPRLATEAEVARALSRAADEALFNLKALAESAR